MVESFKYIKNITEKEGTILLYNQIGDSVDSDGNYKYGISGSSFANELQYLQEHCQNISVRINSIGGSVFDAYSIVSAILNSKVPVNTYIDGLAASSAGVIAVAGKKCYMMDYGTLMLHNPQGGDKAVLALVKDTLVTILSNRTSKSAEEVSAMMDKETWMSASEALNSGMVDEIITSNKKIKFKSTSNLSELTTIYNKILNPKSMLKIQNKLGLSEDASEESIVSEIEKKDAQLKSLQSELDTIKAEVAQKAKDESDARELDAKNKATELVKNALDKGLIKAEEVESYTNSAVKDFAFVENVLSKFTNVKSASKVFDVKNVNDGEDRSGWDFKTWSQKDPKGLEKLQNESPAYFETLIKTIPTNILKSKN